MIFTGLYNRCMIWAGHPHAERYLAGVSLIEAIFFPVPTALMLIPMVVSRPDRGWRLAAIATITSVLGGLLGYLLGYLAISAVEPWIHQLGWWKNYMIARSWFGEYGVWAVAIAGFTPIPFKLFTISAGALSMALLPYVFACLVGRSAQFFLIAALMAWAGPKVEPMVRRYVEWLGWGVILIAIIAYVLHKT